MKQPLFFKIFKDSKVVEVRQFSKEQVVIGREGEIDLMLADSGISPIHAIVEERGENGYYLCDLGSQGGTLLNGNKIVDEKINDGDTIQIGSYTLEFSVGIPKPKTTVAAVPPKPVTKPPKIDSVEENPIYARPASGPADEKKPVPAAPQKPVKKDKSTPSPSVSGPAAMGAAGAVMTHSTPAQAPSRAARATFAPPSQQKSLRETLKPGRGGVVELVLAWQDRVLNTYHFEKRQIIQVGSHPKNAVILPTIGSVRVSHPLVKIEGNVTVYLTTDMTGQIFRENGSAMTFDELKRQGLMVTSGGGFAYVLNQNELMQIQVGENVSIWLRFVGNAPPALLAPFLDLSINQLTTLLLSMLGVGLFLVYVFLYAPPPPEKQEEETIPPRKAQFVYKRVTPVEMGSQTTPETAKTEKKGQQASSDASEMIKDKAAAKSRQEEGKASEAKPNKSKSKEKKLTAANAGKSKGIKQGSAQNKPDAAAAATQKDVKNSGLLGVFGKQGVQDQLNRANQGTGLAGGAAKTASGSGSDAAGAGINPGSGLRDVGQGGNGTATVGISGVNTKGRGGGVTGYGTGSLGGKKTATVIAGGDDATFSGSIDRDAIRRVIQLNINQIRYCYDRGLAKDPGLYGKVIINFVIGPGGKIVEASTKSSTMNNPEVENCFVNKLKTWKFPEPPSDQLPSVNYPFVFQAQE